MNKVREIIQAVSDDDLRAAMNEMKTLRDDGLLPQGGVVRRVAGVLEAEVTATRSEALRMAQVELTEAAAFKWAGI